MISPNYDKSILSITSSILKHYGVSCAYPTLPELDKALDTRPKHVALILMDGMGKLPLNGALAEDSYLRSHRVTDVTSVFPCTTTAAITAYSSGLSPMEHGWLGWHLFMKEYAADVITFMRETYYTKKSVDGPQPARALMPYKSVFRRIREADKNVRLINIQPFERVSGDGCDEHIAVNSYREQLNAVRKITRGDAPSFIMLYNPSPDMEMHKYGVGSPQAVKSFSDIDRELKRLSRDVSDTLIIMASDHGLINATEPVDVSKMPELLETLIMPPSIEGRAAAFFVKPHRKTAFEDIVKRELSADFIVMPRDEVIESGIFGRGVPHRKFDDFIGDYMVIAIGGRFIHYSLPGVEHIILKGQHAGLTENEMLVSVMLDRVY